MTNAQRIQVNCPICESTQSAFQHALTDHFSRDEFNLHRCVECQALFLKDPPTPNRMGEYYENLGGKMMRRKPGRLFRTLQKMSFLRDVKDLEKKLSPGASIIDFGCGDGAFAAFLSERGYKAHCADVFPSSSWYRSDLTYRQIQMNSTELVKEDLLIDGKRPDAIVMRHSLEHMYAPGRFLELARSLGVPHLLVVVPNTDSKLAKFFGHDWYYWDPPRHLSFFTSESLEKLGGKHGYRVVRTRLYGIDEVVTSWHRRALLKGSTRKARIFSPKGPIAAVASSASAFITDAVICSTLALE